MTDSTLTSLQNPRVKAVVQLHQSKYRHESGLILIEGRHPVEEALKANLKFTELYLREGEVAFAEAPCEHVVAAESVLAKMATTDTPPPVIGVAEKPRLASQALFEIDSPFILGFMGIQDPGNFGTLIRSACAFGVTGLLTIGSQVDPFQPKVIRASAGMVFRLPVGHLKDLNHLGAETAWLQDLAIWGADAHKGETYKQTQLTGKTLLLMGGEAHGLPSEIWDFAKPLHIPTASDVESLNVAVAGAILMAEAYQQRNEAS